ncbi:MAG TPA: hypothetical protein VE135_29195 [Pyrinomonadaceae bacterium]|nr:hypothetical protein [Pyrinomonadaceae bacterium]
MKHLSTIIVLGFALSLCNLTNKLKPSGNSNGAATGSGSNGSKSTGSAVSTGPVEHAEASAAQMAALADGREVKWDQQGMSFTVPAKWTEATNETKMLVWRSPGSWDAASLIVNISPMAEDFPTDVSINAFYEGAKTRAKNGEVDEVKWLEIDGLKGLQFREANPEKPDDQRRLQWMAYRKYAGQVQLVNLMLATRGKDFVRHQDAMYGILYSTKLVH